MKQLYARIRMFDRAWYLRDLPRLLKGVNYVSRAQRAGVPQKHIDRIKRRFAAFPYYMRKEMQALIKDMEYR